ncbi:hypothetical protein [Tardiphaga sp. OK246]|jgi:hypothetical protein|uniref:hypothetical protein n=1 Tax=Tardiphaga sp. OK246 TaxID=1855307 RepID=UPI0015962349|nr:hypothetical protein [Tardiphaga sp. OK246]
MLIDKHRSAEEIASHHMGLGPQPELRLASQQVANKIFGLASDFKAESNEPF